MKRMRVRLGRGRSLGLGWLGGSAGTYPSGDGGCGREEENHGGYLHGDGVEELDVGVLEMFRWWVVLGVEATDSGRRPSYQRPPSQY